MNDSWCVCRCRVRRADVDAVEELLDELGAVSVALSSAADNEPLFDTLDEPLGGDTLWSVCEVAAMFDGAVDRAELGEKIAASTMPVLDVEFDELAPRDWRESWRDSFKPMSFGGRLWVCPTWCEPPSNSVPVVRLDPGMAFGTGTHPTTTLCLEWLAARPSFANQRVLDYGCGSGILALAAAVLGADDVVAVDLDERARVVCRENVELNRCRTITVAAPEQIAAGRFDLILANILLEPLKTLAPAFASLLSANGILVLAGITTEQEPLLLERYSPQFNMRTVGRRETWTLMEGRSLQSARQEGR